MAITLRVLDGADRGRVFGDISPPVTVGREEGNSIQLNDERVSRFHLKIQEDHEKLVLTDLESTNGTKVNGEDIQLRILRFGDMITLGRSVLLFGSRDEIAGRLADMRRGSAAARGTIDPSSQSKRSAGSLDYDLQWEQDDDLQATLHSMEPPELPERMSPGQAAQMAELIEYIHIRIRHLMNSVETEGKGEQVKLDLGQWQSLLDLQSRLAEYLRAVSGPHD
ncbi:MAG: FHA domain-containing protein [Planctomycetales bacterium]|nr:FHA domain-containing protein [Planctomycetales bacterium]